MKNTQTQTALFEIASGTVLGAIHAAKRLNNQDCLASYTLPDGTLILGVADGCSEAKSSEFGARLGVQSLVSAVARLGTAHASHPDFWEAVKASVLADLAVVMRLFQGSPREIISEYLLFTLVGAVITPELTVLFNFGDGAFVLNGEHIALQTMQKNQPAYCAYALMPGFRLPEEHTRFQVAKVIPSVEVNSLMVGTDGLSQFPALATQCFPAREEMIGTIDQFWLNDSFFQHPLAISRFLTRLNPLSPPWREGLLKDDTTFFVVRRKQEIAQP